MKKFKILAIIAAIAAMVALYKIIEKEFRFSLNSVYAYAGKCLIQNDYSVRIDKDSYWCSIVLSDSDKYITIGNHYFAEFIEQYFAPDYVDGQYIYCHVRDSYNKYIKLYMEMYGGYYSRFLPPDEDYYFPHDCPYRLEAAIKLGKRGNKRHIKKLSAENYEIPVDWREFYISNPDLSVFHEGIVDGLSELNDIHYGPLDKQIAWYVEEKTQDLFYNTEDTHIIRTVLSAHVNKDSISSTAICEEGFYPLVYTKDLDTEQQKSDRKKLYPMIWASSRDPFTQRTRKKMKVAFCEVESMTFVPVLYEKGDVLSGEKLAATISHYNSLRTRPLDNHD